MGEKKIISFLESTPDGEFTLGLCEFYQTIELCTILLKLFFFGPNYNSHPTTKISAPELKKETEVYLFVCIYVYVFVRVSPVKMDICTSKPDPPRGAQTMCMVYVSGRRSRSHPVSHLSPMGLTYHDSITIMKAR